MIIWSIVIIINFVLTLKVSTSLSHNREPCEIKVVFNHTCSLHTCVCAGSRRRRVRLVAFDGGNCFTAGGFPSNPIPVRVCAKQTLYNSTRVHKTTNVPVQLFLWRLYLMVLRGATSLLGALEGLGPENLDFFWPKWHERTPQNHYVLRHKNNRYINSYNHPRDHPVFSLSCLTGRGRGCQCHRKGGGWY